MEFEKRYNKLNSAQKQAVDCIDGPVMVIAGPGTGKTELLSVRVANILKQTDTLPENILCLTFTDSGANEMRERLIGIIGREAYKVAIHTFHSFGSEVINQNGQFFYQGAHFRPADGLSSYEIIRSIFDELPHSNPLAIKLNDEYTYLRDSLRAISDIKRSGLTSDELLTVLNENNIVIEKSERLLTPIFSERISKKTIDTASKIIDKIRNIDNEKIFATIIPFSIVLADSLENAIESSRNTESTKPLTAWKTKWFKKNDQNELVLKSRDRQTKLHHLSFIYQKYLVQMQQSQLYDFDDMILRVVHAMEIYNELRLNLQERYQYILVDEFQDTNMAQMRILHNLTNNLVQGDTPNIMVVGDDDQAIYSFQGADVSNIINFKSIYPKTQIITLNENYRSTHDILEGSREIILQGQDRLENSINGISKILQAKQTTQSKTKIYEAKTISAEQCWVVQDIKNQIESGVKPSSIAVLTRKHYEINQLLPYFSDANIPINYERQDDVLQIAPIILIEKMSRLLILLSEGRHDEVNGLLPEIMTHPAWSFEPIELCKLSVNAYERHSRWLEHGEDNESFAMYWNWIIKMSAILNDTPLEQMLDLIIGNPKNEQVNNYEYTSPMYNYFFSQKVLDTNPSDYLTYLEALRTIRAKLREYRPDQTPTLKSFINFIDLNRKIGNQITAMRHTTTDSEAVNLMTAHKSKGLEFDLVYITNAVDEVWGEKARGRSSLISYPENLPLAPAGESQDERLRLFYVAITRAKNQLSISYSLQNENGKNTLPASFLAGSKWGQCQIPEITDISSTVKLAEIAWYQSITNIESQDLRNLLSDKIKNYKLSVTHLNNFVDVKNGGPNAFLMQNLLHFPSAKSPHALFGTAVHDTLQKAHSILSATNKRQAIEDIVANFETNLIKQNLSKQDFSLYLQKGSDCLQKFLEEKYASFSKSQLAEIDFANQNSVLNQSVITGMIDVLELDKPNKIAAVIDYKTGKVLKNWDSNDDSDKIKLHKYKQQLLFYKLLIENSRDYHNYKVTSGMMQFVEPTNNGEIVSLSLDFEPLEIQRFTQLVKAVWRHITQLDLPDISDYPPSYKGVLAFEQDLIDDVI